MIRPLISNYLTPCDDAKLHVLLLPSVIVRVRHSPPEMLAPGFKSSKLQKKSVKSLQYRGQLFSCDVEKVLHTVKLSMIQNMISKLSMDHVPILSRNMKYNGA